MYVAKKLLENKLCIGSKKEVEQIHKRIRREE